MISTGRVRQALHTTQCPEGAILHVLNCISRDNGLLDRLHADVQQRVSVHKAVFNGRRVKAYIIDRCCDSGKLVLSSQTWIAGTSAKRIWADIDHAVALCDGFQRLYFEFLEA